MGIKEETMSVLKQYDIGDKFSYLPVLPKAAVLIPLFVRGGELYTLMTLRSKELRTNAGEVCFPGGKRDPGDVDDVDTALREAKEEIGLHPDKVQVVCTLFPIINKVVLNTDHVRGSTVLGITPPPTFYHITFHLPQQRGLLVTPVVGFIEETFCPTSNPAEVSAVFTVPLVFFTREKDHCAAHGATGIMGALHSFYFVDPDTGCQYHIWGLTAMLAILVATLALRKKPEFDVGYDSEDPLSFFQHILDIRLSKL